MAAKPHSAEDMALKTGVSRRSWPPSLRHPYPRDRCEPWWDPRVGRILNCENAAPPTLPFVIMHT